VTIKYVLCNYNTSIFIALPVAVASISQNLRRYLLVLVAQRYHPALEYPGSHESASRESMRLRGERHQTAAEVDVVIRSLEFHADSTEQRRFVQRPVASHYRRDQIDHRPTKQHSNVNNCFATNRKTSAFVSF
jgi:hypothetical protein